MRKSILFGGSILCLFILVSLSYQPIVADTPIQQIKETKVSVSKIDRFNEIFNKLIEIKSKSDCGCEDNSKWDFPIICDILGGIFFVCAFLWGVFKIHVAATVIGIVMNIAQTLGCPWANPSK